ncbi:MAG TPA: hypothetical protein VL199_00280 [Burkholderiales bacterium]|jgi:hypothetical protein|nr:hypothetical protein [Burkholderiales bacterium]
MKFRTASVIICGALAACVFVPRTTTVYDKDCDIEAKSMTMDLQQIGALGSCQGNQCAQILVGAGAVAAASAVISGSIVVAGNMVYWFEKEGRCIATAVVPPAQKPTSPPQRAPSG